MPAVNGRILRFVGVALIVLVAACGRGDGLPSAAGEYTVKSKSISFDGERYIFQWAPETKGSDLAWAKTNDVRLQLDDRTFLQVDAGKKAVLHLTQDEPVTLVRDDRGTHYESSWYPYYYQPGTTVVVEREYRQPVYVYPPTGDFKNGEQVQGSVHADAPANAAQIQKLRQSSNTVAGQNGGTGGGNAATNKSGSAAPAAVATSAPSISTSSGSASGAGSAAKPATSSGSSSAPSGAKPPSIQTNPPKK